MAESDWVDMHGYADVLVCVPGAGWYSQAEYQSLMRNGFSAEGALDILLGPPRIELAT